MPLTLLSTAGYMVAAYSGSGLIDLASPLMRAVSFFPLVSPYLMLTRLGQHQVTPLEIVLAIAILIVTIAASLWFAARIYRVGVLHVRPEARPPRDGPRLPFRGQRSGR